MNIKQWIPNSLTLLNLFCGCVAIVFALTGNLELVPWLLLVSFLADFLDGLVARALKVSSNLGAQLDSLADMVSFGVLPGVIMLAIANTQFMTTYGMDSIEWYSGKEFYPGLASLAFFIIPIFSAIRLAKFNIDDEQSTEFKGVATPAMTVFVLGLLLAFLYQDINFSFWFLCLTSVVLSLLMVVNLPMFSFKLKGFGFKDAGWQYVFIILAILSVVIFKFVGVSVAVGIYVVMNIARYLINNFKRA